MPEPEERKGVVLHGILRGKILLVVVVTAAVSLLHFLTPAGPHTRHWLHLLYQKLYYVPILMAAAFLGVRGAFATALVVSLIFFAHILRDWSGDLMRQAEQVGEIASYWVIAAASSFLEGPWQPAPILPHHPAKEYSLFPWGKFFGCGYPPVSRKAITN